MMRQWELDQNPYLRAILDVRLRACGDFSPEKSGARGEAYDQAVLDCYAAILKIVEASVGRNAKRQDRETGLGPKGEHAVTNEVRQTPRVSPHSTESEGE